MGVLSQWMERLAERIVASVAGMVANAVQVVRISHQVEQQQRLLELAESAESNGCHELAETIRQQAHELTANSETDVRFEQGRLTAPVSELPASSEGIAGGAAKSRSRGKAGRRLGEEESPSPATTTNDALPFFEMTAAGSTTKEPTR
mgnify:CR=1 FL=1